MPVHDWTQVYSGIFHDFQQSWSIRIKDHLNANLLPQGVLALVEQKTGIVEPDVLSVDTWVGSNDESWGSRGGNATSKTPLTRIVQKSTKEHYANQANRIVVQQKLGHTIAVIEIVSPGNKDSNRAFKKFIDKSQEFIDRGIHLIVIDLFPPSKRDPHGLHTAIWDAFDEDELPFTFPPGKDRVAVAYESLEREKTAYVEPLAVGDTIPDMPLFLGGGYHVMVPLEAAYQMTWAVLPPTLQSLVETGKMPVQ